jgi:uncharacterized membrane protein YGL010W
MILSDLFERQLAFYVTYHRDPRNRATHFIGIPPIIFSIVLALSMLRFEVGSYALSAGILVAAAVWLLWILLDGPLGLAMVIFVLPSVAGSEMLVQRVEPAVIWQVAGICFVGGWVFQLLGHLFEGRRPALARNLFQALVGPMFLAAEIFQFLGYRRDLTARVEALAAEMDPRAAGGRVGARRAAKVRSAAR